MVYCCNLRCIDRVLPWKRSLQFIVLIAHALGTLHADRCQLDSIKNGYSLKYGTKSSNVKLLGRALNLNGCKKLCCDTGEYEYGLFDGIKCYGIECNGGNDHRCTLTEDGNADYSIFSIQGIKNSSKDTEKSHRKKLGKDKSHRGNNKLRKDKSHRGNNKLKIKDIQISIKTTTTHNKNIGSRNESASSFIPKTTPNSNKEIIDNNKTSHSKYSHRKHKKRRKSNNGSVNNSKKLHLSLSSSSAQHYHPQQQSKNANRTHNRYSRDYPYTYFNLPLRKLSPVNQLVQKRTLFPQQYSGAYSYNTGGYNPMPPYNSPGVGMLNQRTIYPSPFQNSWYKYYTQLYKRNNLFSPRLKTPKPTTVVMNPIKTIIPKKVPIPSKTVKSSVTTIVRTPDFSKPVSRPVLNKKSVIPKYKTEFDIMSGQQNHEINSVLSRHQSANEVSRKSTIPAPKNNSIPAVAVASELKRKDLLSAPKNDSFQTANQLKINSFQAANQPKMNSFLNQHQSHQGKEEVEPLSEFPTETDLHSVVEKDAIPRPEELFDAKDDEEKATAMITKDSSIDVPFSSNSKLSQPTPMYLQGCRRPLGIGDRRIVPDQNMAATSEMDGYPASNGRLHLKQNNTSSWCASPNSTMTGDEQQLIIDFGQQTMFCRTGTQGNFAKKNWVEKFKLQFSDDGKIWEPYSENGVEKVFFGNKDEKDTTYQTLKNPILSRYVRFQPTVWIGDVPCLRVELFNTSLRKDPPELDTRSDIPSPNDGLIEDLGFEKMDEAVALDRSEFGNNGFLYGGSNVVDTHSSCRHGVDIPLGGDIVFDGTVMKTHPREAITISIWVKLNKVEGVHSIFDTVGSHSNHNLGQFHFEIVGGDVRWFHRNETEDEVFNVITTEKLIKPQEWNHLGVTYDANARDAIIYINGTEQVRGKGHGLLSKDWSERVGIGRHKGSRFLDGQVDEFKLYDKALDKDQITELANKCDFSKYYCGSTLTDNTGTIVSPEYPSTYHGPVECTWNIHGLQGEVIVLDMKQFKLGKDGSCGKANLEVRDGINDSVIGTFCGSALTPRKVLSHSNRMYLKYFTDGALDGEMFKLEYYRENKRTSKKSLEPTCGSSKTLGNVTLVHGVQSGEFTELGSTSDMSECKSRCCGNDGCDVAFLIDNNCYSVKCASKESCRIRKAKPSKLNPRLSFVQQGDRARIPEPEIESLNEQPKQPEGESKPDDLASKSSTTACQHQPVMENVTLAGGIHAGNFTSQGLVGNMDECIQHCCKRDDCDAAFMVKNTCFSLRCKNDRLCESRPAKPSAFYPMVAYMKTYKPNANSEDVTGVTKGRISEKDSSDSSEKDDEPSTCKDMRVSKVFKDVTLNGGISSGDFTDKGHVSSMDECITKCCDADNCNVAFVIKDTCFLVKCKSYENCGMKSAVSKYYNPKIAYINWSPPKDTLGETVPYTYKGCWRDFDITAFAMPLLEGTDPKLNEPYKKRSDPVTTCSKVSQSRGYKVFAVQNGGACFSGPEAEESFKRYGKSEGCKAGKGGPFANSVYKSFDDGSIISLGCWSDLKDRAFRRMEKNDPLLKDNFQQRADPVATCAKVAEKMKRPYFALQKGGQCFVAKSPTAQYEKYSPSRKCKYGLGGQMANDVYMLKEKISSERPTDKSSETSASGEPTVTENAPSPITYHTSDVANTTTTSSNTAVNKDLDDGEKVYKEESDGNDLVRYLYKADPPISNVTLTAAINAGTFVDRGKMVSIDDCVKKCGETPDCNVAFMLSSQCFNVHCFSEDTCKTKPAFSSLYNPQLAYLKRRVLRKPKNNTSIRTINPEPCKVRSELSNVTFIEGIKAGEFTDKGHVGNFDECKLKCCEDSKCHIAFKIQNDCYGVSCFSRDTCKTRPAKNADVFQPEMALLRPVKEALEEKNSILSMHAIITPTAPEIKKNVTSATTNSPLAETTTANNQTTTANNQTANAQPATADAAAKTPINETLNTDLAKTADVRATQPKPIANCTKEEWDNDQIIYNRTLIGGINAGEFREHGRKDSMNDCMAKCCSEKDCDLSFMIDHDCYTVKCSKPELCKTRKAKSTSFLPQIAFKRKSMIDGIGKAIDFVKDTLTELTLDKENIARPFKVLYTGLKATAQPPTMTRPISKQHVASQQYDDFDNAMTSAYQRHHSAPTVNKSITVNSETDGLTTPMLEDPKKHSCEAGKIIHNATLRLGMHSGQFTKIGHVKSMDDCIESCCRSSNADVAYMLGQFCFAVRCKTKDMCKPSPAMYSDIKSLNLNPAISFLNKGSVPDVLPDDDVDILAAAYNESVDSDDVIHWIIRNMTSLTKVLRHDTSLTDTATANRETKKETTDDKFPQGTPDNRQGMNSNDEGTCSDSPITYNVTLRGGIHSGKFTDLGEGIDMRECVGRCCNTPLCDVAFMFSDKCYAVGCYDESKCQAVLAKPSALNPKLAYVSKYRTGTGLIPSNGIGFQQVAPDDSVCSASNVAHGPVYTNRTLLGGMKAGNFSYLGQAKDIKTCLSKCCSNDGCDLAYLVNKDQCFSVKCFSPELCQVTDRLLNNRMIEISKLIKPKNKKQVNRGTIAAYFAIGLLTSVIGMSGFLWAVMIFVKRKRLRKQAMDHMDEDVPRPD